MTIKARLRKREQATQIVDNTPIRDMSTEQLMIIVCGDPVRQMIDEELEEIINAEVSTNGNR